MGSKRGFLTAKQLEILRLRSMGYTQAMVASRLGTSRENVSVVEKRARDNVNKAFETIVLYLEATSKARVELREGENASVAAKRVLREASALGIKLKDHLPELALILLKVSGGEEGRLGRGIVAYIFESGSLSLACQGEDGFSIYIEPR
ncbi:MAG: Tfx family DNA-binding protein [Acidilobaceae archaeon]|nr:Tfx family DNA-binding protein [Acidilobaceae archaeon]